MPTTCGFPNCKFRSRYRGQEDNRHFYRIPKRPLVLRQRWLRAIGRTEETVVSQLRICSAHFSGGEKREGDIPVPDPAYDPPISIQLPPKESKQVDKRRPKLQFGLGCLGGAAAFPAPLGHLYERLGLGDPNQVAVAFANALKCASEQQTPAEAPSRRPSPPGCLSLNPHPDSRTGERSGNESPGQPSFHDSQLLLAPDSVNSFLGLSQQHFAMRPLVALLDGRDCAIEMSLLKDVATVAFCDAQNAAEIHQRVLNEAVVALAYHSIELGKEDLQRFKRLKALVRIGASTDNVDVRAADELGIAVLNTPSHCVQERADSALAFILNLYRRTFWLAGCAQQAGSRLQGMEALREVAAGTKRTAGSRLLLVGLGKVGMAVAGRAKAFGFLVSFFDPHAEPGLEEALGLKRFASLEEAVAEADCISFHCPAGPDTERMVNMGLLKRMRKGVFLVNIGSELLFNDVDVLACLRNGHVGGAALDSHDLNRVTNFYAGLPSVLVTPKMAWYSEQGCRELREAASLEARRVLKGEDPLLFPNCVNQRVGSRVPAEPASFAGLPAFSSASSLIGFPNCLNPPMLMWNTQLGGEKGMFHGMPGSASGSEQEASNGDLKAEERPSSSGEARELFAQADEQNGAAEQPASQDGDPTPEGAQHGEELDPPSAKVRKLDDVDEST